MPVIESKIMINSESFKKNQEDHQKLIDEIRTLEQKIADNSARSKAKFDKRGQLLPRERLKRLLDPGSFWLPLSTLAGYKIGDDDGDKNLPRFGSLNFPIDGFTQKMDEVKNERDERMENLRHRINK